MYVCKKKYEIIIKAEKDKLLYDIPNPQFDKHTGLYMDVYLKCLSIHKAIYPLLVVIMQAKVIYIIWIFIIIIL